MRLLALLMLSTGCVDVGPIDLDLGSLGGDCPGTAVGTLTVAGVTPTFPTYPGGPGTQVQIATAGTDRFTVAATTGTGALTAGGALTVVETLTPVEVTVLAAPGTGYLELASGGGGLGICLSASSDPIESSELYRIAAIPALEMFTMPHADDVPDGDYVFAAGSHGLAVALLDRDDHRLVDLAAYLELDGARVQTGVPWAVIDAELSVGSHVVGASVGEVQARIAHVEVVDTADEIAVLQGGCFAVRAHGAFIAGAAWTFTVDGAPALADSRGSNCVTAAPGAAITASAMGQTISL
jgi:hypothetical protein